MTNAQRPGPNDEQRDRIRRFVASSVSALNRLLDTQLQPEHDHSDVLDTIENHLKRIDGALWELSEAIEEGIL